MNRAERVFNFDMVLHAHSVVGSEIQNLPILVVFCGYWQPKNYDYTCKYNHSYRKGVSKINSGSEYKMYAALRLIEQLTDNDLLDKYIFNNILEECSKKIDTTKFAA